MENIRVFEEDGYIHFIMRPEELRLGCEMKSRSAASVMLPHSATVTR